VKLPFFTVGHSNRSIEEFIALLRAAQIGYLADIRRIPRSRANPQFNDETLSTCLASVGITYERIAALGGLRSKARTVSPEVNGVWENQSFHNYADYALSKDFHTGLDHVIEEGRKRRGVVMCSEAVWWRCHRRIVADHLIARGESVFHIMGEGRLDPARLTEGAVAQNGDAVVYPRDRAE
jgi:uncharacterized protein (DUF488 family)